MFPSYTFTFLLFSLIIPSQFPATRTPDFTSDPTTAVPGKHQNHMWHDFDSLRGSRRGSHVSGISNLKRYLHRFGYLSVTDVNFTDQFDARLEGAVTRYQTRFGLAVSGELDNDTLSQMMLPRCGSPDPSPGFKFHETRYYAYFTGEPRWARIMPMNLTYAFSPENTIRSLTMLEIRDAFKRAFSRWASVIPVNFIESEDYGFADIKIGFYGGDHGDGEPFDGVLGVLAHSFSPETGRLHLDSAETWAVDFGSEESKVAVDLQSVATHEIGHVLGLAHSSVKESVMYPSLKPRERKWELKVDDIKGIQALYGSNPMFKFSASLESDTSSNKAVLRVRSSTWLILVMLSVSLARIHM